MHFSQYIFILFCLLISFKALSQQQGFFIAPSAMVGYDYITKIYNPDSLQPPANKGYNSAFQFGAIAGYKGQKSGVLVEYKTSSFAQNMKQNDVEGNLNIQYNSFGIFALYQLSPIKSSRYYQTAKLGYLYNVPRSAHYLTKNSVTGQIYNDEDQLYAMQNNHMLAIEYGITTGYKLLWADFSLKMAYSINNIYKPLTETNGKNFFIGFQLAFGLFANTNK